MAADPMSMYTLADFDSYDSVLVINKLTVLKNRIANLIARLWLANWLNVIIDTPGKAVFYNCIFKPLLNNVDECYCFIITPAWFDQQLFTYIRLHFPNAYIVMRFGDKVEKKIQANSRLDLNYINQYSDLILVYDEQDAKKYGYEYLPMGYSKIPNDKLLIKPNYDCVFIGAAKDRLKEIKFCYQELRKSGYSCFFYVTGVDVSERDEIGIVYADKPMSFIEYLSYEVSAKCLFEILQENASGRTFRMMEAIIYNKLLITNCQEVLSTNYNLNNVQLFDKVSDIDFSFLKREIEFCEYKGDFSPRKILSFIENKLCYDNKL